MPLFCQAEEKGRRFYETGETLEFEHVENEWPLFYLYMIIDAVYKDLPDQEAKYQVDVLCVCRKYLSIK